MNRKSQAEDLMDLLEQLWGARGYHERFWQFICNIEHQFSNEFPQFFNGMQNDLYEVKDAAFIEWLKKQLKEAGEQGKE